MFLSTSNNFIYENISTNYTITGKGNPIIFLHGFGLNSTIWQHQINFFSKCYMCVTIDLPGHGSSKINFSNLSHQKNQELSTIEFYANWLNKFLTYLQLKNCILVGHSLGGYIALELALKNVEFIHKIALIHTTAFDDDELKKNMRKKTILCIHKYGGKKLIQHTLPNLFHATNKIHQKKYIAEIAKNNSYTDDKIWIQYINAMLNRKNNSIFLPQLKIPIFLLAGKEDTVTPISEILKQSHLPECCYIHVLLNVAHMSMIELPNTFNRLLHQFAKNTH